MFLMSEVPLYRTLAWGGEGARHAEDSNNHGGAQYRHRDYHLLKYSVDGFVGELTFQNILINILCEIKPPPGRKRGRGRGAGLQKTRTTTGGHSTRTGRRGPENGGGWHPRTSTSDPRGTAAPR